MKKTNKCELCGKRYKYPEVLGVEDSLREELCFTCEVAYGMVRAVEEVIEYSYGERYLNFLERVVEWRRKQ